MTRLRAALGALSMVLGLAASAHAAHAQTDDERARLHFNSGSSDFAAGAYEDALREFQRSYELSHRPQLQYNFALCYERLGNLTAAADALDHFLSEVHTIPDRANLESRLHNLRERIAAAQAEAQRQQQQQQQQIAPPPDDHHVAPPPPVVTPPPPAGPNVGAITSFSIAALGLVGAGVFGGLTLAADSSLSGGCGATSSCSTDQLSDLHTWALLTDISFAVAAAGAVAGLLFLVLTPGARDHAADHARLLFVPTVSPTHGGVVLTASF